MTRCALAITCFQARIALGDGLVDLGQRLRCAPAAQGSSPTASTEPRARDAHHDRLLAVAARVDHAHHAHDARDRMEIVEAGILGLGFALARDHEESALAGGCERRERLGAADRQGTRHAREDHGVADRQQRQHLRDLDALATGSDYDATRCFRQVTPIH